MDLPSKFSSPKKRSQSTLASATLSFYDEEDIQDQNKLQQEAYYIKTENNDILHEIYILKDHLTQLEAQKDGYQIIRNFPDISSQNQENGNKDLIEENILKANTYNVDVDTLRESVEMYYKVVIEENDTLARYALKPENKDIDSILQNYQFDPNFTHDFPLKYIDLKNRINKEVEAHRKLKAIFRKQLAKKKEMLTYEDAENHPTIIQLKNKLLAVREKYNKAAQELCELDHENFKDFFSSVDPINDSDILEKSEKNYSVIMSLFQSSPGKADSPSKYSESPSKAEYLDGISILFDSSDLISSETEIASDSFDI